jgi:L-threonylcarbamoyladenylate synthase
LPKHYAPEAKLVVWAWRDEADLAAQCAAWGTGWGKVHVLAHTRVPAAGGFGRVAVIPRDPGALARAFYAELHACDEAGAELIVVEALPETSEWRALADRLKRAAA